MKYNNLGRSGLKVSELSLGSWLTFGKNIDRENVGRLMKQAFDAGVNFFDNAEVYGRGEAEEIMGAALSQFRREDLVVSTKVFWGGNGPNDTGLSRKHVLEGARNSLRRLRLAYVDLLLCHRPDPSTPVEETVLAMDYLVRNGLVLYWGTSEWPAEMIVRAHEAATSLGAIPPTAEQPQYNLFVRKRVEVEYAPLYERFGMGATVWSPLASGILSGKYVDGIPSGSRLATHDWLRGELTPQKTEIVKSLQGIARDVGCSLPQLALAWCLKNPWVSTVITGVTTSEQLQENLAASKFKEELTPQIMKRIESLTKAQAR